MLAWDFVCPAPRVLRRVTSASRRDSLVAEPGRELCDHLRDHHAPGLECGDDAEGVIKDELCARLLAPALRPALRDPHVAALFGCGRAGAAARERPAPGAPLGGTPAPRIVNTEL